MLSSGPFLVGMLIPRKFESRSPYKFPESLGPDGSHELERQAWGHWHQICTSNFFPEYRCRMHKIQETAPYFYKTTQTLKLTVYRHFEPRTFRTQDTSDFPNFRPRTLQHVRIVPTLRHWCRSVFWTRRYTCGVG